MSKRETSKAAKRDLPVQKAKDVKGGLNFTKITFDR